MAVRREQVWLDNFLWDLTRCRFRKLLHNSEHRGHLVASKVRSQILTELVQREGMVLLLLISVN